MSQPGESITISMNASLQQFEAVVAGYKALLAYRLEGTSIVFTHTEVPEAIEGQGIGSALARSGLEYAANHGLSVVPLCPFVQHYIRSHPEVLSLVEPGLRRYYSAVP